MDKEKFVEDDDLESDLLVDLARLNLKVNILIALVIIMLILCIAVSTQ